MDKSSKIKLRLLEYAKNKGISYEKFFEDFGSNYANFKGKSLKSSLRSEVLVDFYTKHPDADLHWLITGETKYKENMAVNVIAEPENSKTWKEKYYDCTEKYMLLSEDLKAEKLKNLELKKN